MRRFACVAVACMFSIGMPVFAAKLKRPDVPIAPELIVELDLSHTHMDADILRIWKELAGQSLATQPAGVIPAVTGGVISGIGVQQGRSATVEATQNATPIWETLSGYAFSQNFEAEIRRGFGATGLSPNPRFRVLAGQQVESPDPSSAPTTVLLLVPRYWMSANFRELTIELVMSQLERGVDKKGRPKQKLLFQRAYAWRYQMRELDDGEKEDYAAEWNRLGARRLVDMVDQGIVQSMALFQYDFSDAGRLEDEEVRYGLSAAPAPAGAVIKQGWVGGIEGIPGLVGMVPSDWPAPPSPFREESTLDSGKAAQG